MMECIQDEDLPSLLAMSAQLAFEVPNYRLHHYYIIDYIVCRVTIVLLAIQSLLRVLLELPIIHNKFLCH